MFRGDETTVAAKHASQHVAEEKQGGVEGLTFNDDMWIAPLTDCAPRPAHRDHAWAGARAAIAATIRSASAPTSPIDIERGSTSLIPAK